MITVLEATKKPDFLSDINGRTFWRRYAPDMQEFSRKFKSWVKKIAKENGWEVVNYGYSVDHFSGFFKCGDTYIYFAYDLPWEEPVDVTLPGAHYGVLYRTAKDDKDYTGGHNCFSSLEDFPEDVAFEMNRLLRIKERNNTL